MTEKIKNTVPNIWMAQENLLHFYRLLTAGLGLLATFMLVLMVVLYFRDPIVVIKSGSKREFYSSSRAQVPLEKSDVEDLTRQFLEALYVWPEFREDILAKEISPFAEEELVTKVIATQASKFGKILKEKKLAQSIAFVKVTVLEDRVVAKFLRILLIEGVPLAVPAEVTLSVIQGAPTRLNPLGVYVGGILEHEGGK